MLAAPMFAASAIRLVMKATTAAVPTKGSPGTTKDEITTLPLLKEICLKVSFGKGSSTQASSVPEDATVSDVWKPLGI